MRITYKRTHRTFIVRIPDEEKYWQRQKWPLTTSIRLTCVVTPLSGAGQSDALCHKHICYTLSIVVNMRIDLEQKLVSATIQCFNGRPTYFRELLMWLWARGRTHKNRRKKITSLNECNYFHFANFIHKGARSGRVRELYAKAMIIKITHVAFAPEYNKIIKIDVSFRDFNFVVGIDEYDDDDDGGGNETAIAVTAVTVGNNSHIKIVLCVSSIWVIIIVLSIAHAYGN